jgi:hypothetical protein
MGLGGLGPKFPSLLFTNARSVPSAYGGGNIGHLAMVLTNADYIARVDVPFVVPLHPSPPPDAALISVALSHYTAALNNVTSYNSLCAALKSHILSEVTASFLGALKDPDLGFKDVTPLAMLTYGTLTPEELQKNRAALSEQWNLDNPLEDLWSSKIANIQPKLPRFNASQRLATCRS